MQLDFDQAPVEARTPSQVVLLIRDQLVDPDTKGTVLIPPDRFGDHDPRYDAVCDVRGVIASAPVVVYLDQAIWLDTPRVGILWMNP
jgi:hypothetical protein